MIWAANHLPRRCSLKEISIAATFGAGTSTSDTQAATSEPAAAALGPGFRLGHRSAALLASMPKDEFEQRIQTYLLDHPEVIIESLNRMEERQRASAEMEVQALIKSHADVLFRDVDSPSAAIPTEMSRSSSSSTITAPIAGRWHR